MVDVDEHTIDVSLKRHTELYDHVEKFWRSYYVLLMFMVYMLIMMMLMLNIMLNEDHIMRLLILFEIRDRDVVRLIIWR